MRVPSSPSRKAPSLILLAFLLPFSIYLFVVGSLNRRRHPVMVSGVTDFIGILFAASGFLLFGGPGALSSLNQSWRDFWLFGERRGGAGDGSWQFWVFLFALYFLTVVAIAVLAFRTQRHLTAVYNADSGLLRRCLVQVCEQMGLDPARSGNLIVFGVEPAGQTTSPPSEAIQTEPEHKPEATALAILQQAAVLELEAFARMRHVTLRWDPPDSSLRRAVESELAKVLAETEVEPSEVGIWLTMLGVTLFGMTVIAGATMVAIRMMG